MITPDQLGTARETGRIGALWETHRVSAVHLGLFDASGVLRQKRLSAASAARALEEGWSFIDAVQWWDAADSTWRSAGFRHAPATVDLGSLRPYPFESDALLLLAEFDGALAKCSPRAQLARMVARARAADMVAEVGWEYECIVLEDTGLAGPHTTPPRPAMTVNRCWSARTLAGEADTLRELDALLAAGSVPLDHSCAELGPGCLELATVSTDALRSADEAALAKLYTKAFFDRRGQTATFMAQLGEQFPGLGGHPTVRLRAPDGTLLGRGSDGQLHQSMAAAIAGVVTLLPELFPMVAATPNSYRRFASGNWAPAAASWGYGNYSCALRVVEEPAGPVRLELRAPGADVSPHHCLAMLLGAATWGVEQDLVPPPPVAPPGDGRFAEGAVRFPRTLAEAVDHFEVSEAACDLFGRTFVSHLSGACRAEDEACRRLVPAGERTRYLLEA
jgi:glutamine synthetase